MITITDVARDKILALMKAEKKEGLYLRFGVRGRGPGGFQYRLAFVEAEDKGRATRASMSAACPC